MNCSVCGCAMDRLSMIGPDLLCCACFGAQLQRLIVLNEHGCEEYERYEIRSGVNGRPYKQWHGVPRLISR